MGCPWDSLWNYGIKGKIIAPFFYLKTKYEVKNAPWVLYVTNKFLQNRYPTNGKNIGCSDVVLENLDEAIIKKRIQKIKRNTKKLILGTIAAVDVKYKGQQDVIRALGILKHISNINYEYQIVGNGDISYLKKFAQKYNVENQVVFLGGLPHEKIFSWLDDIDIYIQPSKQEGMPRALIEAMSRGLPAIGTIVGGIPELLPKNCLCAKSSKKVKEIVGLLKDIEQEAMLKQAEYNFNCAKKFEKLSL